MTQRSRGAAERAASRLFSCLQEVTVMRLIGYCTSCHRVRYVRVTGHALAVAQATRGVVQGVCADCEREEDERRAARRAS